VNFLGGVAKLFMSRIFVDRFDLKNAAKTLPFLLFLVSSGLPKLALSVQTYEPSKIFLLRN